MNKKLQAAEQFRRALQMFAASLDNEKAMEVASLYDPWKDNHAYAVNDIVTYGENGVGDPQLYRVVQAHTSQFNWTPDKTASLFVAIGLDDKGYPVWSQPTGAHDAYNLGDIVNYKGELYESTVNGNTWEPGVYGWELVM